MSVMVAWGPVVEDFEKVFQTRWSEADGKEDACDVRTRDKYSDLELIADCPKHATLVYDKHRERIRTARTRIWLDNAYFFPPPAMLQELADAAKRGVDVKVIMPAESDLPAVEKAARSEYVEWIRHGIRVYEYGRCMNHAKVAVIDDDWSTVGTFNANPTSMALANEVNLFVYNREFTAIMAEQIQRDLDQCDEVDPEEVKRRPLLQQVVERVHADALNVGDLIFGPHDKARERSSRHSREDTDRDSAT
jgi:cardiolipin synthase A/B